MNSRELKDQLRRDIRTEIQKVTPGADIPDDAVLFWQDGDWMSNANHIYSDLDRRVGTANSAAKRSVSEMHDRIDELLDKYRAAKRDAEIDETDHRGETIYLDQNVEGSVAAIPPGMGEQFVQVRETVQDGDLSDIFDRLHKVEMRKSDCTDQDEKIDQLKASLEVSQRPFASAGRGSVSGAGELWVIGLSLMAMVVVWGVWG